MSVLILLQDSRDGSKNQTTFTSVFSRTPKGPPSNSTAFTSVLSGSPEGSAVELHCRDTVYDNSYSSLSSRTHKRFYWKDLQSPQYYQLMLSPIVKNSSIQYNHVVYTNIPLGLVGHGEDFMTNYFSM